MDKIHCVCRSFDDVRHMICCDKCLVWYHVDCIKMSKKEYRRLTLDETSQWECMPCDVKFRYSTNSVEASPNENKPILDETQYLTNLLVKDLGLNPYRCHQCSYGTKKKSTLFGHVRLVHNSTKSKVTRLDCNKCSYQTTHMENMRRHTKRNHDTEGKYNCNQCKYKCKNKRLFKNTRKQSIQTQKNILVIYVV